MGHLGGWLRIRLAFAEPQQILSSEQLNEGLDYSWMVVPAYGSTVGQVAAYICERLGLHATCPDGISLDMNGFVLPSREPADILRDADIVNVRRAGRMQALAPSPCPAFARLRGRTNPEGQETPALRLQNEVHARRDGVVEKGEVIRATFAPPWIEEDGKGDRIPPQVEEDGNGDGVMEGQEVRVGSRKRRKGRMYSDADNSPVKKKSRRRKQQKEGVLELLEEPQVEEILPERSEPLKLGSGKEDEGGGHVEVVFSAVESVPEKPRKKSKKKRPEPDVAADQEGELREEPEVKEIPPEKPESLKLAIGKEDEGGGHSEDVLAAAERVQEKPRKKSKKRKPEPDVEADQEGKILHSVGEGVDERETEVANGDGDDGSKGAGKVMPKVNGEGNVSSPSRSARRKKAKRLWLRTQAADLQQETCDVNEKGTVAAVSMGGVDNQRSDGGTSMTDGEDKRADKESPAASTKSLPVNKESPAASPKNLPVVVRPGHIRFEPLDDQDGVDQRPLPEFRLGLAVKSKKQGQVWGQEKAGGRKHEKRNSFHRSSRSSLDEADTAAVTPVESHPPAESHPPVESHPPLESLPHLVGNLEEGDVLAYRILELSASRAPVFSPFRVGKVVSYDGTSNTVVLEQVVEYPLLDTFADTLLPADYLLDGNMVEDTGSEVVQFPLPYGTDGLLDIDFGELFEVRMVEKARSNISRHPDRAVKIPATEVQVKEADIPSQGSQLSQPGAGATTGVAQNGSNGSKGGKGRRQGRYAGAGHTLALLKARGVWGGSSTVGSSD